MVSHRCAVIIPHHCKVKEMIRNIYIPDEESVKQLMDTFNFDRIVAIRHLRQRQLIREMEEEQLSIRVHKGVADWSSNNH